MPDYYDQSAERCFATYDELDFEAVHAAWPPSCRRSRASRLMSAPAVGAPLDLRVGRPLSGDWAPVVLRERLRLKMNRQLAEWCGIG